MIFNRFSRKEVIEIIRKVSGEYESQIAAQKSRIEELVGQNRELSARLSELEGKKTEISDAILHSVETGKQIEERSVKYAENQLRALRILSDRCRALAADVRAKHPEEDDIGEFSAFFERMDEILGGDGDSFPYAEAVVPTKDLATLCKELGIEDDGSEEKEFVFFDDEETDETDMDH